MDYTSYQFVSQNSQSLNTGSYLNPTEYSMFVRGFQPDLWFGLSANDAIEIGLWDRDQNQIGWTTLNQSKSYDTVTVSHFDRLNNVVTYSYQELKPDYILHSTKNILVDPADQISKAFNVQSGSYYITYNLTREVAGSPSNPLVIKDISPSRKELKLLPQTTFDDTYSAFCQHKFLMNTVSSLYVQSVKNCPYGNIYNQVAPTHAKQIATIKALFFIPSDGQMLTFFKNLYEDMWMYSTTGAEVVVQNFIRIQGINTYFNNYMLSNGNDIVDFETIDSTFRGFVSASIERKFSAAGSNPEKSYVDAKVFVYDFFTKYFYNPISEKLAAAYKEKYWGFLKNGLNFGGNRLLPILNFGMLDERSGPDDPLTLLIKLKDELPTDLSAQSKCWVSNVGLTPFVVSSIIKSNSEKIVHRIGVPDFSIQIPNASLTNTNLSYTANDLKMDEQSEREITVSRNISDLAVDYTDFSNFVVFSSAELRLKIFKNKVITLSGLNASIVNLNDKATRFLSASGSIYPFYDKEYSSLQKQMDDIIGTFDGYESYLYRGGNYGYRNGAFVSSSFVVAQDNAAAAYDKANRDSLINTCPEHVLTNPDNDDYIIFLSMIGHFFDTLYVYISNMPSEKKLGNDPTTEFTRRVVDYMLESFGWKLDDSIEQATLLNNYLTGDQVDGLDSMSAEERLKVVRNRILNTLPQIYKTKGTEEAIRLIMACYGIPSVLLSVREYGGITYDDPKASYTLNERVYMRQWHTSSRYDSYDLQLPTGSHTYTFKVSIDDSEPYTYGKEQILFGRVENDPAGEWAIGFVRIPKKNTGQIFFRIGTPESFKMYSQEFPLFDGNIYSVMLRRNNPDTGFEYNPNYDSIPAKYDLCVKRNEFGNQIVNLTSSAICYNTASNIKFGSGGMLKIGGAFTDINGQGFTGAFDKFQIWKAPLPDYNLEDYTNNFNAYSYRGDTLPYQTLIFRMHTDYPFNHLEKNKWVNGNPYFAVSSSAKLNTLYGEPNCNVDYMVNHNPWRGATKIVDGPCGPESQSVYPYQYKVFDYPSTWGISKYGPNKFRNEKTRYISQSVEARFDNMGRSTYVNPNATAPDSNQVGFFVDPQDFKNRDIVRYFGNFDFMDVIGDPSNEFSQSYDALRIYRNEYAANHNQHSGSRTLFNELQTVYKLYFNRSIFESIKNVIPARTNALLGVVIEPTILERPKYQMQPIQSTAAYALSASVGSLVKISSNLIQSQSVDLDLSYICTPNRDYPTNYGGNYIRDLSDDYQHGHFGSGFPSRTVDFSAYPLSGNASLTTQFTNTSVGQMKYLWDFGDGTTSTEVNPQHVYENPGLYTVTLYGYYGALRMVNTKVNYIEALSSGVPLDSTCAGPYKRYAYGGNGLGSLVHTWVDPLGTGNGDVTFEWSNNPDPVWYRVVLNNAVVVDTGWICSDNTDEKQQALQSALAAYPTRPSFLDDLTIHQGNSGSLTWTKNTTEAFASVFMYAPMAARADYTQSCPVYNIPSIPCGGATPFTGKAAPYPYYRDYTVQIGTGGGHLVLTFDGYSVPNRFQVIIDGVVVIDTLWAGLNNSTYRTALNNLGFTEPIVQYANVAGHYGSGSLSYEKPVTTTPYATVRVYSPIAIPNTSDQWTFTLNCPV